MNKNLFFGVLILAGLWFPLHAYADDSASTTPEVIESAPSTVPLTDTASTTDPTASSTEPTVSGDPSPVVLPSVPITLAIETRNGTLFSGSLTVSACAKEDGPVTVSGYCAIEQSGIPATWTWYGSDAFISTIGDIGNDYTEGVYWNWFSDLTYGMTSLNAHELDAGESLLLSIGVLPLRVSATPEEAIVGSVTTIVVSAFGFNASFEPVWEPAASSTVFVNDVPYTTDATGTVAYTPLAPGTLTISATKEGFIPATSISVPIQDEPDTGDRGGNNDQQPSDPVSAAVGFLGAHQQLNGSFASPLLSDWAAIAFASADAPHRSLKQYLVSAPDKLETATDFERRAMALAAVGINPQKEIKEIVARFDGSQLGERSLINDDIFALIVLSQGGYAASDPIITSLAGTLVASQQDNGAWVSTDLTAAAIQALAPLSSLPGVLGATSRARSYLATRMDTNGCFGNSFATSWGIMAIHALGESPDAWSSASGATPLTCLKASQALDGGFEEGASTDMRVWATAYAIPALSGKTWGEVLRDYPKPQTLTEGTARTTESETITEPITEALPATIPIIIELPVLEFMLDTASVQEQPRTAIQERAAPVITHTSLTASALAAFPSETLEATPESLWTFFIDLTKSIFALIFRPELWSWIN